MGVRCAPPLRGTRSASGRTPFYSEARGAPYPAASAGRAHPNTEKTDQPTRRAHHVAAPCGQASTYETGQGQEPTDTPALSARQICGQTFYVRDDSSRKVQNFLESVQVFDGAVSVDG